MFGEKYFHPLEQAILVEPTDKETKELLKELKNLFYANRTCSLNMIKTTEEL